MSVLPSAGESAWASVEFDSDDICDSSDDEAVLATDPEDLPLILRNCSWSVSSKMTCSAEVDCESSPKLYLRRIQLSSV